MQSMKHGVFKMQGQRVNRHLSFNSHNNPLDAGTREDELTTMQSVQNCFVLGTTCRLPGWKEVMISPSFVCLCVHLSICYQHMKKTPNEDNMRWRRCLQPWPCNRKCPQFHSVWGTCGARKPQIKLCEISGDTSFGGSHSTQMLWELFPVSCHFEIGCKMTEKDFWGWL